jgi:hypothetical protein
MPLFDKPPPSPLPSPWDRIARVLCAVLIWAAVLYEAFGR